MNEEIRDNADISEDSFREDADMPEAEEPDTSDSAAESFTETAAKIAVSGADEEASETGEAKKAEEPDTAGPEHKEETDNAGTGEAESAAADEKPETTSFDGKKREFASLSAAAGKIVAAAGDAGSEAATAAQDVEISAAERAAVLEEKARAAREAAMAGAQAEVDYSVGKGSTVDIYSDTDSAPSETDFASYEEPDGQKPFRETAESGNEQTAQNERISGSYSSIYSDTEGGGTYSPIPEEPESKKRSGLLKKVLAGVLALLMCFAGGYCGSLLQNKVSNVAGNQIEAGENGSGTNSVSISGNVENLDAASVIAEKTMPSVVGISTVSQTLTETIFGLQSGESMGIGTGLIVSEDGYILTNSHVVNDGNAETITVDLYDGTEYSGTILWNDASLDLAIVKIEASGLSAADLGDSDTVNIGDYALAIGNPLGLDFERSVTSGIISGLNRSITVAASPTATTGNTMDGLIQTDASINSGNSGGPLINSHGQIIGINSAKASSAEGLGFAIPINVAIPIIQQIRETGTFESAYLGISGYDLAAVSAGLETDFNTKTGVFVNDIYAGSGAANAGLKPGDVIVAIEGHDVDGMSSLKKQLINYRPGDTVMVTVERDKEEITVDLVLGSASDLTETIPNEQDSQDDQNSEGQGGNENQAPEQQPEAPNGFGPGGLGDLFNDFFGN